MTQKQITAAIQCGSTENNLTFVFNRLVDVDNVESVTVNETKYVLKVNIP